MSIISISYTIKKESKINLFSQFSKIENLSLLENLDPKILSHKTLKRQDPYSEFYEFLHRNSKFLIRI